MVWFHGGLSTRLNKGNRMENQEQVESNAHESAQAVDEQTAIEKSEREYWTRARLHPIEESHRTGVDPTESIFDVENRVSSAVAHYQKDRAWELDDQLVLWDRISTEEVAALGELLDSNPKELEMQKFLEANAKFLVQALGGGHGRYQLSQKKLGSEYVPDFLIAEMSSIGMAWHAVEIESPQVKAHRKDGLQTSKLTQSIGQINDWRNWLRDNLDYARRPKDQNGLGLIGIDDRIPGLILIGRRVEFPERFNQTRSILRDREQILVHSYDWLLDVARSNISGWLDGEMKREEV